MPLTIIEPASSAAIPLIRTDWQQLIAQRSIPHGDSEKMHDDNLGIPLSLAFAWQGGTPPYTLELTSTHDSRILSDLPQPAVALTNLHTASDYTWRVVDGCRNSAAASFTTLPNPRLIALPNPRGGPINLRDLGGYKSRFGGRLRQGLLYRGSHLSAYGFDLCLANITFLLNHLGIKTELDLRYPQQVVDQTHSNFGKETGWIHAPINAYDSFTPQQNEIFRHALTTFARADLYPIYFHCEGGSDRTGEIAFLINGLLGVADEDLFLDYELSSLSLFPRPRQIPYFQDWLGKIASHAPQSAPRHRQIEAYMISIGITPAEIAAIRSIMLS